jgi:DNA-binding HxlR family transcriptional regulator
MIEHEWVEGDDVNDRLALIAELYPTHSYDEIKKALTERGFSPSRLIHDLRELEEEGKIVRKVPPERRRGRGRSR